MGLDVLAEIRHSNEWIRGVLRVPSRVEGCHQHLSHKEL